ncbi:MAG: hypothetical protein SCH71_05010 [Desulfobulbaceae bacterium]|nr:hypothetical protein [Desulfobulbaceae bacterium]
MEKYLNYIIEYYGNFPPITLLGQITMIWQNRFQNIIAPVSIAILMASGCATAPYWETTSYGTMKYSQAEIERLPGVSIRNILSSMSENEHNREQIFVRSTSLDGPAEVNRLDGQEDVIVTNRYGQEVQIKIAQITEIKRIRRLKVVPRKKSIGEETTEAGEVLTGTGEVLIYASLVPVAIAMWPFFRAIGLDEGKNDDDKEKASLAYGGMSKEDLVMYVGEPKEKYCREVKESGRDEVWVYEKDKVLRGGRALFISGDKGVVYHTSHNTTFFKNLDWYDCMLTGKQ